MLRKKKEIGIKTQRGEKKNSGKRENDEQNMTRNVLLIIFIVFIY